MPKNRSLKKQVVRFLVIITTVMFLFLGGMNIVINILNSLRAFKRETAYSMEYAISLVGVDYLEKLYSETLDNYEALCEEGFEDSFSLEYTERLMPLVEDSAFWRARDILSLCAKSTGINSVCLIAVDKERDRTIYIIDGFELDKAFLPGQWDYQKEGIIAGYKDIEKIAGSETDIKLTHGLVTGWTGSNYIKIYDTEGNVLGYAMADMNVTEFVLRTMGDVVLFIVLLLIFLIIFGRTANFLVDKNFVNPINSLAYTAKAYTERDKAELLDNETFFDGLNMSTGNELQTLWVSLVDMERDINETMLRIRSLASEKEKVQAELSIATAIQEGMLKRDFPAFPDRDEFDIYASMDPAKEVGGDLYDFFLIDDDHLCLTVGDVSGKGIPASLFMLVTTTIIRNVAKNYSDLSQIMKEINNQLCVYNRETLFVTLFLGIYTISGRRLDFANAGHEYPAVFISAEDGYTLYCTEHDVPMGIMDDADFASDSMTLPVGSKLFIYSDGVPEATRSDDEMFGNERMLNALNKDTSLGGKETLMAVRKSVDEFVDGAPQFDDLTMLYFEVKK